MQHIAFSYLIQLSQQTNPNRRGIWNSKRQIDVVTSTNQQQQTTTNNNKQHQQTKATTTTNN